MDINIGEKIKIAREKMDWSQSELAKRAGVQPSTISQIESGARKKPTIDVLQKISTALSSTVSQLLGTTDEVDLKDLLQNEEVQMFFRDFKELSEKDKAFIREQMEFFKSRKKDDDIES